MSVGVKYDGGKPRWSLLPTDLMWGIVGVLEHGAKKYSPNNWMHVANGLVRYSDAAARHLSAIEMGEVNDPDSGLPHAYHYACCALYVAWLAFNRPAEVEAWRKRGDVVVPVPQPVEQPPLDARPGVPLQVPTPVPGRHEHIFELCDSGTAASRKWVCKCGDYVTHENGTHKYVRAWISGRVQQTYATYYDAQRGR